MASVIKVDTIKSTTGNTALTISESGIVKRSNIPAFWVYGGADTSATNPVVWTQIGLNQGNCYNITNGRFTAPIDGLYAINFRILGPQNVDVQCRLYLNGTVIEGLTGYGSAESDSFGGFSVSAPVLLSAGDYLQVYVTTGSVLNAPNYNSGFSGWLIG